MNSAAAFGSPRSSTARRSFWISERMASGCSSRLRSRATCRMRSICSGSRSKSRPGTGSRLPLGQHEAAFQQRRVGLRRDRRRPERLAQDARLQNARQPRDLARGQEIVAHETFDAVLPAVARVAHARADHRLQIERQPLLGAAGDVVQMEPHRPQELPGAAAMFRLRLASARRRHRPVRPWSACRRRSARSSTASAGRAARRGLP